MGGIAGWCATPQRREASAETIQKMSAAMKRSRAESGKWAARGDTAVSVSGLPQQIAFADSPDALVSLFGHPRWKDEQAPATEIAARLATGFSALGPAVINALRGDFALAIVCPDRNEVFLATDRNGVRPVVYRADGDSLMFGSSIDALIQHPRWKGSINAQAVYDYIYFHMIPSPGTIYENVLRLEPGCYAHWRNRKLTIGQYWQPQYDETKHGDVRGFKEPFISLAERGVRQASEGAQSGAFLSGGTDSSTISGMLCRTADGVAPTFSIGFDAPGFDEMEYARIAARHFSTQHHEYYVTPQDVVAAIPLVAEAYDQPFGNASAVPTYYCARLAQENGVERMLGGDGGDELFGGNARYAKQHVFEWYGHIPGLIRGILEPAVRIAPSSLPPVRKARSYIEQARTPMPQRYESYNLLERLGRENVFTAGFLAQIDPGHPMQLMERVYGSAPADSLINRMLFLDRQFTLADNDLPKVTRMCEIAGVDVAFPFLSDEMVDFAASLPPHLKLKGTRLRYFFKEALKDFLPREIIEKEKHGFGLPFGLWLNGHRPLQELAFDSLTDLRQRDLIRPEFLDQLSSKHLQAHSSYYGTMVWVLMMLEQWFKRQTRVATEVSPHYPDNGVLETQSH